MADEIVESFLSNFKSKNTIRNYRIALDQYFEVLKIDKPNNYFTSERNYTDDVKKYCESMKDLAPKTFVGKIAAVKSFFGDNEIYENNIFINPFPNSVARKFKVRKIGSTVPITRDEVFTRSQLKEILSEGDTRTRAFLLVLASSGLRPGELLNIKLGNLDLKHDPPKINVPKDLTKELTTKNKEPRITFISYEAKEYLGRWLEKSDENSLSLRDKYLKSYGNIRNNFNKKLRTKKEVMNDQRVFPFTPQSAWRTFQRLLARTDNLKTVIKDANGNERKAFHLHTFRKFARSNLPPDMPVDMVEQILGHSGYLDEYRKYSDETLSDYYKKAMANITIFESLPDLTEVTDEIDKLKKENTDLRKNMQNLMAKILSLDDKGK